MQFVVGFVSFLFSLRFEIYCVFGVEQRRSNLDFAFWVCTPFYEANIQKADRLPLHSGSMPQHTIGKMFDISLHVVRSVKNSSF